VALDESGRGEGLGPKSLLELPEWPADSNQLTDERALRSEFVRELVHTLVDPREAEKSRACRLSTS